MFQWVLRDGEKYEDAYPVQTIGDNVKHISRDHNQEADHRANWGAEGGMKVTVEGFRTTTVWKEVRGNWDGSKNKCGGSGCGTETKAVHRECWVTVRDISVPLMATTALAADLAGAYILTEVLEVLFGQANECNQGDLIALTELPMN